MPNLTWTHYRELLAVNEEKARYEGEDGKGNPIYSSKYLLLYLLQIYFHIKEICDICESRTHLFFLTDCTDHTDFMLPTATGYSTKSCAKDSLYRTGVQEE